MQRKLCSGCGEFNLIDEVSCWACGGCRFASGTVPLAGERTVCLSDSLESTQSWERDRRPYMALAYVGAGFLFALFMCVVGFWVGRASAPEATPTQPAAYHSPVQLPTPPTGLATTPTPPYAAPAPSSFPRVSVRSVPGSPPIASPTPVAPAPYGVVAPNAIVPSMPASMADSPPPATVTIYGRAPAPLPNIQPSMPAASTTTAVVSLRNDSAMPVDVTFEGTDTRTARIGTGSTMPLVLAPGTYQIRVSGGSASSAKSTAVLSAGRTYSLMVDGRKEEGKMTLVIIEPAIDGIGG